MHSALVQAVDALHERFVVGVANRADRGVQYVDYLLTLDDFQANVLETEGLIDPAPEASMIRRWSLP